MRGIYIYFFNDVVKIFDFDNFIVYYSEDIPYDRFLQLESSFMNRILDACFMYEFGRRRGIRSIAIQVYIEHNDVGLYLYYSKR